MSGESISLFLLRRFFSERRFSVDMRQSGNFSRSSLSIR